MNSIGFAIDSKKINVIKKTIIIDAMFKHISNFLVFLLKWI